MENDNDGDVKNIDYDDSDNIIFASELVQDIMIYSQKKDKLNLIRLNPHLDYSKRYDLVNWILQILNKLNSINDTRFLTISIFDRYVSLTTDLNQEDLKIVLLTSLFIASKFEDIYYYTLETILYYTDMDSNETSKRILNFECTLFTTINWNLTTATSLFFLRRYSKGSFFV